ncbi:Mas-related G-protein coupled receptor member D [Paenibacillus wenxiniae]|uniref:Mas-related G-protein coupled receptor member D n=1 Tax=Paenibacillus wenxiniae TaxID=1636843 RepID=A0ABW4RLW1_9BACL
MEAVLFVLSMLALACTLFIFVGMILNSGIKGILDLSRKPVKWMTVSFGVYIVLFAAYIWSSM